MANPKLILKLALSDKNGEEEKEGMMCELVEKAFTTRNLLHFAHLSTKSYASHVALRDMYYSIIDKIDDITEVYQGKFGLLSGLEQCEAKVPSDICKHVKEEANWIDDNRAFISKGFKPVDNMLDDLLALYSKTIYKLENLH